jgi:hypothetical protein
MANRIVVSAAGLLGQYGFIAQVVGLEPAIWLVGDMRIIAGIPSKLGEQNEALPTTALRCA